MRGQQYIFLQLQIEFSLGIMFLFKNYVSARFRNAVFTTSFSSLLEHKTVHITRRRCFNLVV